MAALLGHCDTATATCLPYLYPDPPSSDDLLLDPAYYMEFDQGSVSSSWAGEEACNSGMMMNRGDGTKRLRSGDEGCSRISFRMKSELEILDDGFRWRKYGKKSVKNSPNPRNYYRCSSQDCGVKKRVERDPEDQQYVITTYEGVHNHASPDTLRYICSSPQPRVPSTWISWQMPSMVPNAQSLQYD